MSVVLCRTSDDIPLEYVQKTSKIINEKLKIPSKEIREKIPISSTTKIEEIIPLISSNIVEKGQAIILIAFTNENVPDDHILGIERTNEKIVFVNHTGNIKDDLMVLLHNLGHCFGAGHCVKCTMNPNNFGNSDVESGDITNIYCDQCRTTIEGSDLFLVMQKKEPRRTDPTPKSNDKKQDGNTIVDTPFPSYDLLNSNPYEFLYQAIKHHHFGDRR